MACAIWIWLVWLPGAPFQRGVGSGCQLEGAGKLSGTAEQCSSSPKAQEMLKRSKKARCCAVLRSAPMQLIIGSDRGNARADQAQEPPCVSAA